MSEETKREERANRRTIDSIDIELRTIQPRLDRQLDLTSSSNTVSVGALNKIVDSLGEQQTLLHTLSSTDGGVKMANRGPNLKIPEFDGTQSSDFETWLREFERKYSANNWPDNRKAATMVGYGRGKPELVYGRLTTAQQTDYDTLVAEVRNQLRSQDRLRLTRQRFEQRHQLAG